jgi:peptidoglycan hydrolase-like protein with peptidoglycan-binding domain
MNRTLSIGDTGPDVENWQRYLISQGYKVATDGKFGPSTLAATRSMQRKLGVMPDGRVGHRTLDRQAATQATPLPQARPDMPPAPQPGGMANTPTTGDQPYVSSGTEADLNAMHSAASNRAATDAMAQELQSQYYDARKADMANQGAPPPVTRAFTDQGAAPPTHALDPAIMAARGIRPDFSIAGPSGGEPSMDFSGTGGALSPMGAPAPNDPRTRDMVIRMLLQGAGG